MPDEHAPEPTRGSKMVSDAGDWIRSTDLFNWIILVGVVIIASVVLAKAPLALLVLSLTLVIAGALRWWRWHDAKWGVALIVAGLLLFPIGRF